MQTSTDPLVTAAVKSVQLMAGGSPEDFGSVIHPSAVNREAVNEPPGCRVGGPEAFHATSRWLRAAFDELAFSVEDVVRQDDMVVVHGRMSGQQTGDFVVHAEDGSVERVFVATGRRFSVRQAHFHRLRDGLVVEHWAVRDDQGMGFQLGWVPPTPWYLIRCGLATARARRNRSR